ncbi:hypothetical protein AMST5_00819 [freshwater sediment metagenome]|uniref:Uncharacterized protein n=1 Tax=freshwater sediment metagenome TaxID=556182 RepID=A0AA48R993_9ZZZZ
MPVPFANDIAPHGWRKPKRFNEFTSAILGVPAVGGLIVIAAYSIIFPKMILK